MTSMRCYHACGYEVLPLPTKRRDKTSVRLKYIHTALVKETNLLFLPPVIGLESCDIGMELGRD